MNGPRAALAEESEQQRRAASAAQNGAAAHTTPAPQPSNENHTRAAQCQWPVCVSSAPDASCTRTMPHPLRDRDCATTAGKHALPVAAPGSLCACYLTNCMLALLILQPMNPPGKSACIMAWLEAAAG